MSSMPLQPELDSVQPAHPDDVDDLPLPEQDHQDAANASDEAAPEYVPHVFDDDEEMRLPNPVASDDEADVAPESSDKPVPATQEVAEKSQESPTAYPKPDSDAVEAESLAEAPEDDDLFAKLAASPSSVAGLVTEWLARVQVNGPAAVADVLSLIVRLARPTGCPPLDLITPQMVISNDPSSAVKDVAHVLRTDISGPVPAVGKDPVSRKQRRAYDDFWRRLAAESTQVVLFDTDCFDTLISWLEAMAVANSRALRTASCLAAYRLVDGFIDFGARLRKRLGTMQKQLATEKRKCGVAPDQVRAKGRGKGVSRFSALKALSQKGKDLAKKVDEMTANNSELVELSNKVFDSILVLKYRDVSPEIRTISVTALGSWIISYPDHFLDDKHTKYIGWLLSDKDPVVRRSTLEMLWRMVRKKDFYPSLEMFLQRFCDRIMEMSRDKDDAVAVAAIRLLTTLTEYELLDEKSCEAICDTAVEESQTDIRRAAGEFLSRLICMEDGQEAQTSHEKRSAGTAKQASKKHGKSAKDLHNPGLAEIPQISRCREHILELLFAITRKEENARSPGQAVDAVWDHLPALRCWEAFAAIFAADRNMGGNPDSPRPLDTSSSKLVISRDEESESLKESDLATLCEMLVASVREASGHGDSHRAAIVDRGERDSVDTPALRFSRTFLPELPLLLVQFQADVRALCALVQLPMHFQMECLEQEGQENHFKDILTKLVDLMSRHTGSPNLVKSCAQTFRILLSDKNPLKKLTLTTLHLGCSAAAKDLALQVRTDLSIVEPLSVAAAILRVRVMSELTEPTSSVRSSVVRLLGYQVEKGPMSDLTDEVTADAARTGCAMVAWWLSKIRARLDPADSSDDSGDRSVVLDEIKEVQEHGAVVVGLLRQICSSVSFSVSVRMVCLQGLLTTLTLCRGVEKFSASKARTAGSNDVADENTGTDSLDFLGLRPALDSLAAAVTSCTLAVIEHVLEIVDHSLTGESRSNKENDTSLSETEVRDVFASLVQSSFQSMLSLKISHLPILGLLLKHRKPNSAKSIPSEWTTFQLSKRYCQQRHVREAVRIQQEVRALRDVGDMQCTEGVKLARQLADSIATSREPGQATERVAKQLLEGLMEMVVECHTEGMDASKAVGVLSEAGFVLVGRLTVGDATFLVRKLQSVTDLVRKESALVGNTDASSLFEVFRKCLESVASNEIPEIPKLQKRKANNTSRGGSRVPQKRKKASNDVGVYHSASPVDTSNVRRSGRDRKKVDYARLSGLSEDTNDGDERFPDQDSATEDDESQITGDDEDAERPATAAEVARNMLKFTNSPRIPATITVAEPDQLPLQKSRGKEVDGKARRNGRSSRALRKGSSLHTQSDGNRQGHDPVKTVRDGSGSEDVAKQKQFSSPEASVSPGVVEKVAYGESPERLRGASLQAKPFSSESKGKSDTPNNEEPFASESNREQGPLSPLADQRSSGSPSLQDNESGGRSSPNGAPSDAAPIHSERDNGEPLRRSPRKLKGPVSSTERDSSSPSPSKKTSGQKPNPSTKGRKSPSGTQALKTPKPRRAKRGRRNVDSSSEDKENIERHEASSPVKHSSPSQPVIKRTKRRKRW